MGETCRICGRVLCGNQRRWIFHTAAKLNLQVLLSHVLGKEISRDGKAEFVCSKCAFMLERIYRFDTVIARIEALSIERLQKLLLEKDRLKFCIASMYKKNNGEPAEEAGDNSNLPDIRYSALLQEDFTYSVFECWTESEERVMEPHMCHTVENANNRHRRCGSCAVLRVADSDYEAICKIPRKMARNVSCGPSSKWSASICNEELPVSELVTVPLSSEKVPLDEESMEEDTPGSSLESLDTTVAASPSHQKDEETDLEPKRTGKCDCCVGDHDRSLALCRNRLDLALSLVKAFDCKPVQSPRGSKLPVPVKSSLLCQDRRNKNIYPGFLNVAVKSHSLSALVFPLETSDLRELWDDFCMDYIPLRVKNSCKGHHRLTQCDLPQVKQLSGLSETELLEKNSRFSAINKQLEMKLNEMNLELKTVQHASQKQDHKIQNLNESLKDKEKESEELYHVIEGQNETITRLQDMLHRCQLGQLQLSDGSSMLQQKQKVALLDAQNALFLSQLEVQQQKRAQQKKEIQMTEARRTIHFLETVLREEEKQKDTAWKYNQELRVTLQQLETELQDKKWQCFTLEREHFSETQRQEQKIQHLNHKITCKEQLLQESKELLQYYQNLDENPTAANNMIKKLQQRIKDRDAMLEEAIDEKFFALEDREQELQQLHLSVKGRERDLDRLHRVLSNNEATIQGLDSLLKAKGLELEQLLVSQQSLQWLKEEVAARCRRWQAEQEGIIQQLRTALSERNKELEVLSARLLCKLGPGQRDIVEELYLQVQQKEEIIEELLRDKSQQAMEQIAELQELLKAMSTKEQQNYVLRQESAGRSATVAVSKKEDSRANVEKGDFDTTTGLEKDLIGVKEELELLRRKERESSLELSALQSLVASQEKNLQVQASDIESLTRSIQIKEELIKDLQMQLVNPEEMPVVDQLTKEVLALQEKVAKLELQGQGGTGNRRQELLMVLEGLVSENNQLNQVLKAEKQLYSSLMKFRANTDGTELGQTLQAKLEVVQVLREQLEEALGRSLECLNRLESLDGIGGLSVDDDAEDASTEFTDSIEEETQKVTCQENIKGDAEDNLVGYSSCLALPSQKREHTLQVELVSAKSEIQQAVEQKKKLEGELQNLKNQIEEAGFSSVSQLRKALLSLYLENAELKEQVGEAMLSEGWENEDEKEDEENLRLEVKKLQEKLRTSEALIDFLREQLNLNSQGCKCIFKPQFTASVAQMIEQLHLAKQCNCQRLCHNNALQWQCPLPQDMDSDLTGIQVGRSRFTSSFSQQFMKPAQQFHSELLQCRQPCDKKQDTFLASEATIQAQMTNLEQYRAQLCEPKVQQNCKQIQVDLQDLGYETCGKSENEADREMTTSPEYEDPDMLKTWKKTLRSSPSSPLKPKAIVNFSECNDPAVLRQQIQELQLQLQRSRRVIHSLQSRVRSVSMTSDYVSGGERPLKWKQDCTATSSPSHSITDEDEGWHSDSFGSFCPPSLHSHSDLAKLSQRVSLLEKHLGEAKPKLLLPEELKPTASMGKYDSLVQAQARELSHLRQLMREGQGMCHILSQHIRDTVKSFEELLRGTDIDYYWGQNFREQLTQGNQLAEQLMRKLNRRNDLKMEGKSSHELHLLRLSKELQEKEQVITGLQAKLQECSVTPSSSPTMPESTCSDSSTSFLSDDLGCSDTDDITEYIFCQDDSSEDQFHDTIDKDCGSLSVNIPAQSSCPSATTTSSDVLEKSVLRNLTLPSSSHLLQTDSQNPRGLRLPAVSPVKPASVASAFTSNNPVMSSKHCFPACHHIHQLPVQNSTEWNKKSREGKVESRSPSDTSVFRERSFSGIGSFCSSALLSSPNVSELEQLQKVVLASHSKLQNGERENEQQQTEQLQLQDEIQCKHQDFVQLQKEFLALQKNNCRLQQRVTMLQQQCKENWLHFQALKAELHVYEVLCSPQQKEVTGIDRQDDLVLLDVNKQGSHIVSQLKNYSTLKKQILEGKILIHKMASILEAGLEPKDTKIFSEKSIRELLASTISVHHILEKTASLLAIIWKAILPLPYVSAQEASMKKEIQILKAKLTDQESRLRSASCVKESMENVLLSHLTRTYDVLRKARANLEVISQQPTSISTIMIKEGNREMEATRRKKSDIQLKHQIFVG